MPTTWATTRVCAVHVVELLKVPNYWLCLPMSHLPRSFLSLYNCSFVSRLPRGLNDVQLSVSRTAVLLVVKKRGTDYRGYCGFVLGHTACSASAWPCWKSGRMEVPSGVGRPAVFSFFFWHCRVHRRSFVQNVALFFFSVTVSVDSLENCLLWSGVFIYILCKIKTTRCLLWGDNIRMRDVRDRRSNVWLVACGSTRGLKGTGV